MKNNLPNPFNVLRHSRWETAPRDPITAFLTQALAGIGITGTAASVLAYLGTTMLTSAVLNALTPKPKIKSGTLFNAREAAAASEVVYGKVRKGGIITYLESSGDENKYLHMFITLAGHEVEAIDDIYINDQVVAFTTGTEGFVADTEGWGTNKVYIKKFTGASGQDIYTTLDALTDKPSYPDLTDPTTFKGEGIACIYVRLLYDRDVFTSGIPNFTAVVRGKKVENTSGVAQTYPESSNAALVIRDYLISAYGLDTPESTIDDTAFGVAANDCDDDITIEGGGTEKRYQINGVLDTGNSIRQNLNDMVSACGGNLFYGQGKFKLIAGVYTTYVNTFDLDDVRSSISLQTRNSRRDNFNKVNGTFIWGGVDDGTGSAGDWIDAEYPTVVAFTSATNFVIGFPYTITEVGTTDFTLIGASSNTVGVTFTATGIGTGTGKASLFLGEDNGYDNVMTINYPLTTSPTMAQRLAKLSLLRVREQMTLTTRLSLKAFDLDVGDVVRLNFGRYGWTNKEFEVLSWKLIVSEEGVSEVEVNLRETSQAAYSWNSSVDENAIVANNASIAELTLWNSKPAVVSSQEQVGTATVNTVQIVEEAVTTPSLVEQTTEQDLATTSPSETTVLSATITAGGSADAPLEVIQSQLMASAIFSHATSGGSTQRSKFGRFNFRLYYKLSTAPTWSLLEGVVGAGADGFTTPSILLPNRVFLASSIDYDFKLTVEPQDTGLADQADFVRVLYVALQYTELKR